jgi:repressor LexA
VAIDTVTAPSIPTLEKYRKKILAFFRRNRRMPSYSEITALLGFRAKTAAAKLLRLGVVAKDATGRLVPRTLGESLRVLGTVKAGWPSPVEEELIDTITLDQYLIRNKEATYLLRVSGDSLTEAGIMPGDQVLVERGAEAKDGSIVIADVDGAWTIKYYRRRGGKVVLMPGNKKYKPIVPREELRVAAVVRAVIRKY